MRRSRLLDRLPIPRARLVQPPHVASRCQRAVDPKRLLKQIDGFLISLSIRSLVDYSLVPVGSTHPPVRQCKIRVKVDSLLEILNALSEAGRRKLMSFGAAFQKSLISLSALGIAAGQILPVRVAQIERQLGGDIAGNLILLIENLDASVLSAKSYRILLTPPN